MEYGILAGWERQALGKDMANAHGRDNRVERPEVLFKGIAPEWIFPLL